MKKTLEIAESLMERSGGKLTWYEALRVATEIIKNETLEKAFMVNQRNYPVALEAIAMALGFEKRLDGYGSALVDAVNSISESMNCIQMQGVERNFG